MTKKQEPQLVLQPSIHDYSREQIEEFIEVVRTRRMTAAIEYHANKNAKIAHESQKIQNKYNSQLEKLAAAINKLEQAEDKVLDCVHKMDLLKQELGMLTDKIVVPDDKDEEGDE